MKNKDIFEDWLVEQDMPTMGGQPDAGGMQAPGVDPTGGQMPPGPAGQPSGMNPNQNDPNIANMQQTQASGEDMSQDPQAPEMPDQKGVEEDFEIWKNKYFKESIKGDTNQLIDILNEQRNKDDLQPYQRKFIEDNFNVQLLRQNSNIEKASNEIRRNMKDQLDQNNPATSVVNHTFNTLSTMPMLNAIFIKMSGYGNLKGDLHRKFIASLTGAVQVGSGSNTEDIIYNEREYSVMMSTRFNAEWGAINLGNWSLKEDDPERFLSEPEAKRLQEGSPEEKEVLRRRVVVESIADFFKTRAFIINVVADDGTVYTLGMDFSNALKGAYKDGKLVVRTRHSDNSEAMITDDGEIIPYIDLNIYFVKETGEQDEDGMPATEEIEFVERRNGILFLKASYQTIKDAASVLPGFVFKETPYTGNPSDLRTLRRCVYSAHDLLLRQC
ncbi:MAG: hypothetical protein M0R80_08805 [Proteobacteria bacterium]|jgi:hypothetical protein|nr:hypothetical protein [Pseudomonadota bacterium]